MKNYFEEDSLDSIRGDIQGEDEPPGFATDEVPDETESSVALINSKHSIESIAPTSLKFLETWFPGTSIKEWNKWQWQVRNSITNSKELSRLIGRKSHSDFTTENNDVLPLRITPYYASLIWETPQDHPLRKTVVPSLAEMITGPGEFTDPLHEEDDSPIPNLVHRYPDRVLFLATGFCSTYCRYCTRTHMVSQKDKCHTGIKDWEEAFKYIAGHPEVRDVLVSGGDPLTLPDAQIEYLLTRLREIPHVEIIRIGTKVPVVLPMRITPQLVSILRKFHPLYISIHFTHASELTMETTQACERLANAGIPLGSQTVLLAGVNDTTEAMKTLMQGLLKTRVRPYYLYQCDPIPGSAHFRTPVSKGIEIIRSLRGFTTGYAVPQYVIDAPGGGGKIPLLPEYLKGKEGNDLLLENFEGKTYKYPDVIGDLQ